MKKSIRLISILVMVTLAVSMMLVGCTKKEAKPEKKEKVVEKKVDEKTLEQYMAENPDLLEGLSQKFEEQGVTGGVEVKGNALIMRVDLTEQMGEVGEITDEMKSILKGSFDGAFDELEPDMAKAIKMIESSSGINGIEMRVEFVYDGEIIYERTFTS